MTIQLSNSFTMGRYTVKGNTIELTSGESFLDEDFYVGSTAYLSQVAPGGLNYEFDIDFITTDGTLMTISNVVEKDNAGTPTGGTSIPEGEYNNSGTNNDILRSLVESNGLVSKFGFVPNGGNVNFVSPLDNVIQAYKFDGLRPGGAPGPVITGSWDSAIQGSNTGQMTCQFIQVVQDNGVIKDGISTATAKIDSIQEFQIVQKFIIPYYQDDNQEFTNNVQKQIPPTRLIDSLKHVFEFEFRQNLSDPNKTQFGEYNTVLGNVKYYNDNYIDVDQQYSVSDVVLTDTVTSEEIDTINASGTTRVTCSINSANGTFLTADPVLLEHSYLPNGDKFANQTDIFTNVWLRETLRNTIDAPGVSDTIINDFTAVFINANQIDVQFDISFSVAQQTQLQEGYNYELSIKVADTSLTVPFSDVTKLIIQADSYTLNTDIAGLATFPQSYFYTRPMMYPIANPLDRFTSANVWIQDGVLYDWYMNLNVDDSAFLEALTLRLVAFNTNDNTWFELDNYNYDLSAQVLTTSPDVQNIEIDQTRGYNLADGDKLNFAKLQTGTYSSPNQPYTGQTAFRISWQDWISLPTADTVFYNPAEPNNGLNKNASNYSLQNGYVICVLIDARISKDGIITQYINRSANLETYDFDQQDGSPITWAGVIQTFDEGGADLGGTLLNEGLTTIRGHFTPNVVVSDPSLYWGEVRLERLNNPGDDYFVLSTLEAGADNNTLQAPTGSTFAKIDVVGGDVEVTAVLNPALLPEGSDWCPSVRFGLIDQSIPVVDTVAVQIDGNTRQTDGDFFVFQQNEVMANASFINQLFNLSNAATPGTPTGWQFKVSPTSAEPGGDANVKSNWGPLGDNIAYVDFNTFAATIGVNGDRWVYIEADDTQYSDEGFILQFDRPEVGQPSSSLLFSYSQNTIDMDRTIWFDRKINITAITINQIGVEAGIQIVTGDPDTDDWTDLEFFQSKTAPYITTSIAAINAQIAALPDNTKYALRIYYCQDTLANWTMTVDFDYIAGDGEDYVKTISVNQTDRDVKWRDFQDSIFFGDDLTNPPYPNSVSNIYAQTPLADTAILDIFDVNAGVRPFTISAWLIPTYQNSIGNNDRDSIFNVDDPFALNGHGGMFLYLRQLTTNQKKIIFQMADDNGNIKKFEWDNFEFIDQKIMHVFLSHDGSGNLSYPNTKLIINGINCPENQKVSVQNDTFNSQVKPVTIPRYFMGRWRNRPQSQSSADRYERLQIWDSELTTGDCRKLLNDPDAARNGAVTSPFRDYDPATFAAGLIPDLSNSQDLEIVTSGIQPVLKTFYNF
ncbi:MAG: hypothetical protein HRU18_12030 [Pseudoalteromonas sp.]|uniref:hypothetical protein n=1 Tax=Pseudoalteromonas sp. TaxID=53249 RepID=UPI001D251964|nr:hypothetical protein [Pseudoalteromonas sp.]NRA78930.1 hypothetical protein [Pseudoalteromonas sp.]